MLEAEVGQPHLALSQLIKQCLENDTLHRPDTDKLLTTLEEMKVEVEKGLDGSVVKLEAIKERLVNEMKKNMKTKIEEVSVLFL